jgi:prepilin-type N-terminal cleavage/methylation domain-containing protein
MQNPISIILADDHEVVRKGVRSYLETIPNLSVVAEACSGEETIALVREHIPDVVLLDLIMPGMEGVDTIRSIKNISPRTQVVVLTSYHEDAHIFPALKAGAISYILKDMKMDKLVEALHRAIQGEVTLHPRVAVRGFVLVELLVVLLVLAVFASLFGLSTDAAREKARQAVALMDRFEFTSILFPFNWACWYKGGFGPAT